MGLERQQVGTQRDGEPGGMAQHGLDVLHGLAVGTRGGGLVGRGGAGGEQQLDVAAVRGVVDDARRVVVPVVQVPGHLAVEAHPLGGGQRVLDGLADELVPEPDVGGVAGQEATVLRHRQAVVAGAAEHLDGGALDPVRDDGDGPHDLGVARRGAGRGGPRPRP